MGYTRRKIKATIQRAMDSVKLVIYRFLTIFVASRKWLPYGESIKHASEDGMEFWYVRELVIVLDKARIACQNSGYIGLYGGIDVSSDIHKGKKLNEKDKTLDFMSSTELIANLFRLSQTEEKLEKDKANEADETHFTVGKEKENN